VKIYVENLFMLFVMMGCFLLAVINWDFFGFNAATGWLVSMLLAIKWFLYETPPEKKTSKGWRDRYTKKQKEART